MSALHLTKSCKRSGRSTYMRFKCPMYQSWFQDALVFMRVREHATRVGDRGPCTFLVMSKYDQSGGPASVSRRGKVLTARIFACRRFVASSATPHAAGWSYAWLCFTVSEDRSVGLLCTNCSTQRIDVFIGRFAKAHCLHNDRSKRSQGATARARLRHVQRDVLSNSSLQRA